MHVKEVDVNSFRTSKHAHENTGSNMVEHIVESGKGVDVNTVGADICEDFSSSEPHKGLEFETKEAAYSFYREYAKSFGFGITIKASRRSKKSRKFIDIKIACSRFGSKREKNATIGGRSCSKTNCKASMHIKRRQDGKWYIYSFEKEHNHGLCPDDFYCALRGRNKQNASFKKRGMQLALDAGDMQRLLQHFMLMQSEDPNCCYAIDFDREKCVRNFFWVDAKGRHDYSYFCDVVLFDMYYIRKKYKIPLVPIVGVNQHSHFILLGCALLGDESASTFVWLMRTWLQAMEGLRPGVIITDENKFLKEAVGEVFPDVPHLFCLWHVFEKVHENLSSMDQFGHFLVNFNKCLYQSWNGEEFEKKWQEMVENFDLKENKWMQSLYEDRKKWAPTYMRNRNISLAGCCTTARSESVSSFFDKYLHQESTLKEFIDHYKIFLRDTIEEEAKADFETRHKQPILRSLTPFEKQMSTIYTHAIFKKFQEEVMRTVTCNLRKECENKTNTIFQVHDVEEQQYFIVEWKEAELEVHCSCRSFEYKGFLCRHALRVFQISGVFYIPPHYIVKRWMREAKIGKSNSVMSKRLPFRVQRFNDLCKLAVRLASQGSSSQETHAIARHALEALKCSLGKNIYSRSILESNAHSDQFVSNVEEENRGSGLVKNKKKKQKKLKLQTEAAESCVKMQGDSQLMGLGSRTILGYYYGDPQAVQREVGYFGNQQGAQELGQLHPISTHVDHYDPQKNLQGLGQRAVDTPIMHGCFDLEASLHNKEHFVDIALEHLHDKHLPLENS